jgi:ribosomal protein S17E
MNHKQVINQISNNMLDCYNNQYLIVYQHNKLILINLVNVSIE